MWKLPCWPHGSTPSESAASLAGCSSLPIVGGDGGSGGLSYGDTVEDEIVADGPRDPIYNDLATPHEFSGSSGDRIRATQDSQAFDCWLLVVDGNDNLVVENDDRSMSTLNSGFETTLPADGTYTLWPGSLSGQATGGYTLSLEKL
ncbi:peptidase S1 and S6 chymotrypsin/Hap [Salinarchaeum sp. Harcht-Bsk1]|uniref:hypothetical protein n=1 Tax=Salinarchaeum sp. Harcht-Bsk1 TaxID=1333523 RepID=UPI0003423AA0|nr:hypothetical protein [Salinarchaeum sp. Harcht-Bsk1]AGN02318.1 peptidase S1 and S6 chymotrypsin/Hap [Salinarchaeum sp. Harcht-Bsk1]